MSSPRPPKSEETIAQPAQTEISTEATTQTIQPETLTQKLLKKILAEGADVEAKESEESYEDILSEEELIALKELVRNLHAAGIESERQSNSAIDDLQKKLEKAINEKSEVAAALTTLSFNEQQKLTESFQAELKKINEEKAGLSARINTQSIVFASHRTQAAHDITKQIQKSEEQIKRLQEELKQTKDQSANLAAELKTQLSSSESQNKLHIETVEELNTKTQELANAQREHAALQKQLDVATAIQSNLLSTVAEHQESIYQSNKTIGSLHVTVAQKEALIDTLYNTIGELGHKNTSLEKSKQTQAEKITDLQEKFVEGVDAHTREARELEKLRKELAAEREAHKNAIDQIETQFHEYARAQAELQKADIATIRKLKEDLAFTEISIGQFREENDKLKTKNSKLLEKDFTSSQEKGKLLRELQKEQQHRERTERENKQLSVKRKETLSTNLALLKELSQLQTSSGKSKSIQSKAVVNAVEELAELDFKKTHPEQAARLVEIRKQNHPKLSFAGAAMKGNFADTERELMQKLFKSQSSSSSSSQAVVINQPAPRTPTKSRSFSS